MRRATPRPPTPLGSSSHPRPLSTPPPSSRAGARAVAQRFAHGVHTRWPLRPELLESLYIMAALEPEPERAVLYRRRGLVILEAIEVHCRTATAYSGLRGDARSGRPRHTDTLESFFLAETLKYLYLLFAAPEALPIDLRAHVLTTEAHILPAAPLDAAWDAAAAAEEQGEGAGDSKSVYPPWWS